MLQYLGALRAVEGLSLPGLGSKIVENSPTSPTWYATNQCRAHFACLYWALTLGTTFPCSDHPRLRSQTTRDSLFAQGLPKLFKLADPRLVYPTLPIPSYGNHNRVSCPCFLLTVSASLVFPPGAPCGPPFEVHEYNKLSSQWQSSPHLLASPYVNNNKPTF